ncbi:transposase [Dankookia rubra]|uniref:Transposase n=1 Tax=Dankookia rubra TaxID=1442381 RepID=A0A4R5QJ49_9PROT|nr:transposase [Dankookia rubra]
MLERLRGEDSIAAHRLLSAHTLIASPVLIVVDAADEFHTTTTAPHQLWQTGFAYLKVIGWGGFYLPSVLNDFSRTVMAWKLCTAMVPRDVTDTLELALAASGCAQARVRHRPRLLSDNGLSTIIRDLADWLASPPAKDIRGALCYPQTQRKIERWHKTLQNRLRLEHSYLPGELEVRLEALADHDNHRRAHESLGNRTPTDVYFGRGQAILSEHARITWPTIQQRRLPHQQQAT